MKRVLGAECLVLSAWVLGAVGLADPAQKGAEGAALVTVVVESGVPLRDLTRSDFVVKEGNRKLEVVEARLSRDPLSAVLLLSTSEHTREIPPTNELRGAAGSFVGTVLGMNPDGAVALWEFASGATATVNFTSNANALQEAASRLFFNQQTTAALLEALGTVAPTLADRRGSRRAIVTVDFDSPDGSAQSVIQRSADNVTNSGATLWAVSVRSIGASNPLRDDFLEKMTRATGGKRYSLASAAALEPTLKAIAASLTSQYLVTFTRASEGPLKPLTFETTKGAKVHPTQFMR